MTRLQSGASHKSIQEAQIGETPPPAIGNLATGKMTESIAFQGHTCNSAFCVPIVCLQCLVSGAR